MHIVGNDSKIVDKVKEGFHKGLFELDLHGWDHINYTKLNESQQRDSLSKANAKMERLFGAKSIVSIPPYDVFNNDTIKAMGQLGIKIISMVQQKKIASIKIEPYLLLMEVEQQQQQQ